MIGRLGTLALSAVFAGILTAAVATPASADPPPWSAAYYKRHHDPAHCNDPRHNHVVYPYPRGSYYPPVNYGRNFDDGCNDVRERIAKARAGLGRWSGTGRHEDAQRAWREILAKSPQRLRECRIDQARRYDNRRYAYETRDDYYGDPYGGDPYYGDPYGSSLGASLGGSFELKRDWPYLLGGLLGQFQNR